ncbi:choice-of-anchor D domain-containing protein, partial [bacterium]|nr:choice-of-anchor D domain-containing protein [bacterium]
SVGLGGAANTATAGVKSGSATVSFTSTGGPGTAVINSQTVAISGTVWNAAAANSISGTIDLGTVLKGTSLSQALSISNTAPADGYSEKLDAAFGTLTGNATTNGGSINLLAAGGTNASSMSVGIDTLTAGGKTGSVQVNFTSNGLGTSGLGTLSLAPQTVSLTATVLDPALPSWTSGTASASGLFIDLGEHSQGVGSVSQNFSVWNIVQTLGYTADLDLVSITSGTGNFLEITTTLAEFTGLGPGGSQPFSASLSLGTLGAFTNTYTLGFKSSKNATQFDNSPRNLTLTVTGVIVVPEPGAFALAGVGIGIACCMAWRRSVRRRPHEPCTGRP